MVLLLLFGILLAGLIALLAGTVLIRGRPATPILVEQDIYQDDQNYGEPLSLSWSRQAVANLMKSANSGMHVNDWAGASAGALPA